jgi:hypothetical protein
MRLTCLAFYARIWLGRHNGKISNYMEGISKRYLGDEAIALSMF